MAKGAGMLAPSLATMLCVLTTDAVAEPAALDQALRRATARTFDRLDIDGCCSTNDTVLLLASGASGIAPAAGRSRRCRTAGLRRPVRAATGRRRGRHQARHRDGDRGRLRGASAGSGPVDRARQPGQDRAVRLRPQLGPGARGRRPGPGGHPRPDRINVSFNGSAVCIGGVGAPGARDVDLSGSDIDITVDLSVGDGQAAIRTTDLSHAYVEENSAYST